MVHYPPPKLSIAEINQQIMKIRFTIITLLCLLITVGSQGQTDSCINDAKKDKIPDSTINADIRKKAIDSLSKFAFARMVAGTDEIPNMANYASFKPTDGKFTLSSNFFFPTKSPAKSRRAEQFSVGVSASGDIVNGNVATLFEEGTLNTGVDLGLRLNWRISKPMKGTTLSDSIKMQDKVNELKRELDQKLDSIERSIQMLAVSIRQNNLLIHNAQVKITRLQQDSTAFSLRLAACTDDTCRLPMVDSILSVEEKMIKESLKLNQLKTESIKLNEINDAIQINPAAKRKDLSDCEKYLVDKYGMVRIPVGNKDTVLSYKLTALNKARKEYDDKLYNLHMASPIAGISMSWLSAIVNWNRLSYRTYYDSLAFESALSKQKFTGLTLGLQFNLYKFYGPVQTASLFNIALLYKKTNNLEDLSASTLNSEKTTVNGSITRKSATAYTVYTDPIEQYNTIQLPVNYYGFFGKNLNYGWHLMGQADWRNNNNNIYDLGAGFIFGVNNTESKKILNIEIFAKYRDITREIVDEDITGWKQLQFGFSMAVPFFTSK